MELTLNYIYPYRFINALKSSLFFIVCPACQIKQLRCRYIFTKNKTLFPPLHAFREREFYSFLSYLF